MIFKVGQVVGYLPVKVTYVNYEQQEYHIDFGSSVLEGATLYEDDLLVLESEINKEAAKERLRNQIQQLQSRLDRLGESGE
jgi:hypothetical protein